MRPLKKKKLNNFNTEEEEKESNLLAQNLYEHLYAKKEIVRHPISKANLPC